MPLTKAQADMRRAEQKAARKNAKVKAKIPLLADQVPKATATEEYWKTRRIHAQSPRDPNAERMHLHHNVNLWIVRQIAKQHMTPEEFAAADAKREGEVLLFWGKVLTGGARLVLSYERISKGWNPVYLSDGKMLYVEKVELREKLVWPPTGWTPPLTKEEYKELTTIPPPQDMPGVVDPLNLGSHA